MRADIEAMRHDVTGIEHRLIQVVRNAYRAATQRQGWTTARRLEAGAALIRYMLLGSAMVMLVSAVSSDLTLHELLNELEFSGRYRPRLCKNAEKSAARKKIELLERPLRDFLGIGNGHPTRKNFLFLRFYPASASSRPSRT